MVVLMSGTKVCPTSAAKHSWSFDGDDPYVTCHFCNEMRDAISGRVLRAGVILPPLVEEGPESAGREWDGVTWPGLMRRISNRYGVKKPATEPADTPIQGCNCASYNNPERVRPTTSGPVPEVVLTPPPDLGIERETVCVDACIATVVLHLWSCGVVTLGSCCGHGRERPSLVLGDHEDFEVARACIAEVIPKNRWVGDEYGWDLSQWRLVENIDLTPADAKLMAKLERDAARPVAASSRG